MSGPGVRMAATMKLMTMAYRRKAESFPAVRSPIWEKNQERRGIWKTTPKASMNRVVKVRYSFMLGRKAIWSVIKPAKNLRAAGRTTK